MMFELKNDVVQYLDQKTLNEITDKQAVDDYMACAQQVGHVSIFINEGLRALVRDLVEQLPAFERKIIRMRFWGNYSITEIAKVIGLSEIHTKEILEDTLRVLKEKIIKIENQVKSNVAVKRGKFYV